MNISTYIEPAQKRTSRRSEMLSHLECAVNGADNLSLMLECLLKAAAKEMKAERTSLTLHDSNVGGVFAHNAWGVSSVLNQDLNDEDNTKETILCVPIRTSDGETIGVVQAMNKINGVFSKDDQSCLKAMACRVANTIRNAEFSERMEPLFVRMMKKWLRG